jgi:hypothetical protein
VSVVSKCIVYYLLNDQSMDNCKSKTNRFTNKKWKWTGHTVINESCIAKEAFRWNPQGKGRQSAREAPAERQYEKKRIWVT